MTYFYRNILIAVAVILVLAVVIVGCRKNDKPLTSLVDDTKEPMDNSITMPATESEDVAVESSIGSGNATEDEQGEYVPNELVAMAESESEAKEIGAMYGLTLKNYSYGVAVYYVEDGANLDKIIQDGIDKGYPELYKNYIYSVDGACEVSID